MSPRLDHPFIPAGPYDRAMPAIATWRKGHEIVLEDGRAHTVVVDFRPEDGGTSAGTTPVELSVLALAGSLTSTFVTLARKHGMEFSAVKLVLEGGLAPANPGVGEIHGTLRVRSRADRTDVEATLRSAVELCPVGRIFREANVPVHVILALTPPVRDP